MSHTLQSALDPAGRQASLIYHLWLTMFWVTAAVFIVVAAAIAVAVIIGRRGRHDASQHPSEFTLSTAVVAAVAATVGILFVLLAVSVRTQNAITSFGQASAISISITGHQWWWEVEYEDAQASQRVTTANEIHIPIARPVVFKVSSHDVIHSFWVPNLHGKRDLVPGITTAIWLQADRPGTYRGQCAEFCGRQHAHMGFEVVAESQAEFDRWLDGQRQTAAQPQNDQERRGETVFVTGRCSMCHKVRGTEAYGTVGPDLTHIASRRTLAAGSIPNARGHLAGWIVDPQSVKPGNVMPRSPLPPDDLQALVAYLEILR
jgi:cytochrome c oxidase subunit II